MKPKHLSVIAVFLLSVISCETRIENFPEQSYGGYPSDRPRNGYNGPVKKITRYYYPETYDDRQIIKDGKIDYIDEYFRKDEYMFTPEGFCTEERVTYNHHPEVFDEKRYDNKGRQVYKNHNGDEIESYDYDDVNGMLVFKKSTTDYYGNETTYSRSEYYPVYEKTLKGWKVTNFDEDRNIFLIEKYDRKGRILEETYYDEDGNVDTEQSESYRYITRKSRDGKFRKIKTARFPHHDDSYFEETTIWLDGNGGQVKKQIFDNSGTETETADIRVKEEDNYIRTEYLDGHGNAYREKFKDITYDETYEYEYLNYYDKFDNLVLMVKQYLATDHTVRKTEIYLWDVEYYDTDYRYDHKKENPELFAVHYSPVGGWGYSYSGAMYDSGYFFQSPSYESSYGSSSSGGYGSASTRQGINCPSCNNSGVCSYCNGTGYAQTGGLGLTTSDKTHSCIHCGGSRICPVCNGNHL